MSDEKLWDESPTSRHLQVLYHQTSFQKSAARKVGFALPRFVGGIAPLGGILRCKGAKKTNGVIGGKTTQKGIENAQPLIAHRFNPSTLCYDLLVSCKFLFTMIIIGGCC